MGGFEPWCRVLIRPRTHSTHTEQTASAQHHMHTLACLYIIIYLHTRTPHTNMHTYISHGSRYHSIIARTACWCSFPGGGRPSCLGPVGSAAAPAKSNHNHM
jgi:hypothetical protein